MKLERDIKTGAVNIHIFLKWLFIGILIGTIVGLVATAFCYTMSFVTEFRTNHKNIVFLLPFAGLFVVWYYRACKIEKSRGTNLVLESVRTDKTPPFVMMPLIFVSTAVTHLFGGSAGREGAALQIGGSLASKIGSILKLNLNDMHIITMCGMSAAFAGLFGTPVAAAIFAMEVVSVGVMHYAALVPCAIASVTACGLAGYLGVRPEGFAVFGIPALSFTSVLRVIVLAGFCALVSILFCIFLHGFGHLFEKYFKNPYKKAFIGGLLIVLLMLVFGRDYLGAGMDIINNSITKGYAKPEAFLLKMLFTAITLEAGFKGGEIVPSFFIGATFGCAVAASFGLDPSFAASVGLMAVFCGVTNCPLTAFIISIELFGMQGAVFYFVAVAVSYMLSGYYGLYSKQKILYSKTNQEFIDKTLDD